jgi:CHAD domain-containing protein
VAVDVETERKFSIDTKGSVPDLSPVVGTGLAREHELRAVYFDTPDFALARHQRTLRRRTGGTDAGWHLKLPAGGDSRTEVLHPLGDEDGGQGSVPRELRDQVAEIVGYAPLLPIAELATRRVETDLINDEGTVVALLCDDTVTATRPGKTKRWRELEIELTGAGNVNLLDSIAATLLESGVPPADTTSKLVRALGKTLTDEKRGLGRKSTAAEVIGAYIAEQIGVIQGRESEVRADKPDAVHKMRVATRRLRSTLRTFRPLLNTEFTEPLRSEIKWLSEMLGGPRDAEVLRDRLLQAVHGLPTDAVVGPVAERITSELTERHKVTHAGLLEALDSRRYHHLADSLVQLAANPPFIEYAHARAKGLLQERLAQVDKKTLKEWDRAEKADGEEQLTGWHETRKRAKAARYAWEAAQPALGDHAVAAASAWEEVTDSLGVVQDTTVARERLKELAEVATKAGEPTFSYGVLYQREIDRTADFHSQAAAAIQQVRDVAG